MIFLSLFRCSDRNFYSVFVSNLSYTNPEEDRPSKQALLTVPEQPVDHNRRVLIGVTVRYALATSPLDASEYYSHTAFSLGLRSALPRSLPFPSHSIESNHDSPHKIAHIAEY